MLQKRYQTVLINNTVALIVAWSILTNCMSNQNLTCGNCEHIKCLCMLATLHVRISSIIKMLCSVIWSKSNLGYDYHEYIDITDIFHVCNENAWLYQEYHLLSIFSSPVVSCFSILCDRPSLHCPMWYATFIGLQAQLCLWGSFWPQCCWTKIFVLKLVI